MRRRPQPALVCSTVAQPWDYAGVCSTSLIGSFVISSTPFVPGDISSESPAEISPSYHARCPYCGTARKPFTYVNCINCGAPA